MADTTIVNLPALAATPATDDLIEMVDISDTGNNATGENKKMTVAELVAAGGGGGGGMVLLETIANVTAGAFDFGPALAGGVIPQIYNRLIVKGTLRGDATGTTIDQVYAFFNGDEAVGNYWSQVNAGLNGGPNHVEGANPLIGWAATADTTAGHYSEFTLTIEDYAGANIKQAMGYTSMRRTGTEAITGQGGITHDSMLTAVTQLTIKSDGDPTDQLLGTLRLYGEM